MSLVFCFHGRVITANFGRATRSTGSHLWDPPLPLEGGEFRLLDFWWQVCWYLVRLRFPIKGKTSGIEIRFLFQLFAFKVASTHLGRPDRFLDLGDSRSTDSKSGEALKARMPSGIILALSPRDSEFKCIVLLIQRACTCSRSEEGRKLRLWERCVGSNRYQPINSGRYPQRHRLQQGLGRIQPDRDVPGDIGCTARWQPSFGIRHP